MSKERLYADLKRRILTLELKLDFGHFEEGS